MRHQGLSGPPRVARVKARVVLLPLVEVRDHCLLSHFLLVLQHHLVQELPQCFLLLNKSLQVQVLQYSSNLLDS